MFIFFTLIILTQSVVGPPPVGCVKPHKPQQSAFFNSTKCIYQNSNRVTEYNNNFIMSFYSHLCQSPEAVRISSAAILRSSSILRIDELMSKWEGTASENLPYHL